MAEGRDLSRTLQSGSEALFDHECVQCHAHGSRQEAIDFCQDCKQFLCNTCGRYHIRNMTTHALVSIASMNQAKAIQPTASPVSVAVKCPIHPDLDIEMYCGTHDMVYCCRCIAKEHRSCSDVTDIDDVAHKANHTTLQSLVADITRVRTQLHTTKLERSNDLKLLKQKRASLLDEIKALRKKFNKHLDALEEKIISELDEEEKKLMKEIGGDITAVDELINASEKTKPDMTSHLDEKHIFITEKLGRAVVANANTFLKKSNRLKHLSLIFEPNVTLCDAIEESDHMGNIARSDAEQQHLQRRNYTIESTKEINVRVKSDKNKCGIKQMCQLADGTILLIDYSNYKLKRLDDQLNVRDFLDFKASPRGLCSMSPTEVAVRMNDNTIHFIHVDKSLSDRRNITINHSEKNFVGFACCSSQFWICSDHALCVYSLSGALMKTIDTDDQGQTIFAKNNPHCIAVNNDETKVYVTTWDDRVVVFNKNGDMINELRDSRLNVAHAVCVTEDDVVLVSGLYSKNVVMFDRDGNSLDELISSKDMLSNPKLYYDKLKCRLLVGYTSDKMQLFQLT